MIVGNIAAQIAFKNCTPFIKRINRQCLRLRFRYGDVRFVKIQLE